MNTRAALSLLLMIPMMPVKKAAIPDSAAKNIGIEIERLLKKVSPPACPNATIILATRKKMINAAQSPRDHFPRRVFGMK